MKYYIEKTTNYSFDEAVEKVTEELKKEGFGILSEINIHDKLKEKLDVDFKKYRILGACNPGYAHKALLAESHIGLMLPCNVIVQEHDNGEVEVSAVDPIISMQAVENEDLQEVAQQVRDLLEKVIEHI